MKSGSTAYAVSSEASLPPRLRLKADGRATGYVDGGWWPRSSSLQNELPGLATELVDRLGHPSRIAYDPSRWDPAPAVVDAPSGRLHLDDLPLADSNVVIVSGLNKHRVILLVIPALASAEGGEEALRLAAGQDHNFDHAVTILALAGAGPADLRPATPSPDTEERARDRWDDDGGHSTQSSKPATPSSPAGGGRR